MKKFKNEHVLEWEDFHSDYIHVRREVSKTDERDVELSDNPALRYWLKRFTKDKVLTGPVIPVSDTNFRQRMRAVFEKAGVEPIHNGLRHSAISYYIAMYPDVGVARVSSCARVLRLGLRPIASPRLGNLDEVNRVPPLYKAFAYGSG